MVVAPIGVWFLDIRSPPAGPPQRPEALIVWSRSRQADVDWRQELSSAQQASDAGCDLRGLRRRDLGPTIDGTLRLLKPASGWDQAGDAQLREAENQISAGSWTTLAEVIEEEKAPKRPPSALPDDVRPPRWLIESVELSTVLRAARQYNVRTVVVAPGPTEGPSPWHILEGILKEQGVLLCIVGQPKGPESETVRVTRIAHARMQFNAVASKLTFWALVDGKAPAGTVVPLRFRLQRDPGSPVQLREINFTADEQNIRLVPFCVSPNGGCPSEGSRWDFEELRDAERPTIAAVSEDSPTSATATILSEDGGAVPGLVMTSETSPLRRLLWARLLDPNALEFIAEKPSLLADLHAIGVALPRFDVSVSNTVPQAWFEDDGQVILVASDEATLARARTAAQSRQQGLVAPARARRIRVVFDRAGASSALSFLGIAFPGQTEAISSFTPRTALTVAGTASQPIEQGHERVATSGVVVFEAVDEEHRYVVISLSTDAAGQRLTKDPLIGLPLLRAVAWAATVVTDSERTMAPLSLTEGASNLYPAAPLIRRAQLDDSVRESLRFTDLFAILIIGCYLLLVHYDRPADKRKITTLR